MTQMMLITRIQTGHCGYACEIGPSGNLTSAESAKVGVMKSIRRASRSIVIGLTFTRVRGRRGLRGNLSTTSIRSDHEQPSNALREALARIRHSQAVGENQRHDPQLENRAYPRIRTPRIEITVFTRTRREEQL